MKRFAQLIRELDETTRTNRKVDTLTCWFREATTDDAHWALRFLCGRRPRRLVTIRQLQSWCAEVAEFPQWMFDECYEFVGDLAETIALLLPERTGNSLQADECSLHQIVHNFLLLPADTELLEIRERVLAAWSLLDGQERLVFNKLLTGGFRVGVSRKLVVRALAAAHDIDPSVVTHRLMGAWHEEPNLIQYLTNSDLSDTVRSRPYPFCLAHSLTNWDLGLMGVPDQWIIERKWDGIRAQIIRRANTVTIWSRGEEIVTQQFPELSEAARELPEGTVLDGEILIWLHEAPAGFSALQKRLGRKIPGAKILKEYPARFAAFDLLESDGVDVRSAPLHQRRELLNTVLVGLCTGKTKHHRMPKQRSLFDDLDDTEQPERQKDDPQSIFLSECFTPQTWQDCSELRAQLHAPGIEGLMIKHRLSVYGTGRATGDWWKWKVDPYRCDAVLVYAQRGHGRRAGMYTDYTFAVWHDGQLVPFTKAYSGLTDEELQEVDRFIQSHTLERFGPVRKVQPELVFELAFEGLQRSDRHKAGIAVRFPRIVRQRTDKAAQDADTLEMVRRLADPADRAS